MKIITQHKKYIKERPESEYKQRLIKKITKDISLCRLECEYDKGYINALHKLKRYIERSL
jgi:hypothetical protein